MRHLTERNNWWVVGALLYATFILFGAVYVTILHNAATWLWILWWGWNVPISFTIIWNGFRIRRTKREIDKLNEKIKIFERRPQG